MDYRNIIPYRTIHLEVFKWGYYRLNFEIFQNLLSKMSSREVMLLTSYGIEFWTRNIFSKIYFGTRKISIRASFGNRVQKWSKLNPARYSVGDLIIRVRPSAVLKDSNLLKNFHPRQVEFRYGNFISYQLWLRD